MPKSKKKEEQTEDTEEVQEGQEKEQSDLQKFVATALRQPKGGIYEQLLSQFLAQAVIVTDPLKRVKVVCEAALMIPEPERKDLAIDYERIDVLNQVTNALLNPIYQHRKDFDIDVVSVPWPFSLTEENFGKFINPWSTACVEYWAPLMQEHCAWHWEQKSWNSPYRLVIDQIIDDPKWSWFFDASNCLSPKGFNTTKNAFAAWAIPQVQLYLVELTQVVNPNVYAEVLGLATRNSKRSYADKVKETAKPTEGPSDET